VLPDVFGATTSFAALLGHGALLAFMDSRCAPRCPFLGQAISDAEELVPAGSRPAVVVVSIDPAADSVTSVRSALRRWRAAPGWHWLSGTLAQLTPVWRAYGISAAHATGRDSALYLIDARGDERAGYLPPILPNFLALDIRRIETDSSRQTGG
jgi:protein SCO1/2